MSTMSECVCWGSRADAAADSPAVCAQWPAGPDCLWARYRRADEQERLCLYLQHRELRPQLGRLEASLQGREAERGNPWAGLAKFLGLPRF